MRSLWNDNTRHFLEGIAVVVAVNALDTAMAYIQNSASPIDPATRAIISGVILMLNNIVRDWRKSHNTAPA